MFGEFGYKRSKSKDVGHPRRLGTVAATFLGTPMGSLPTTLLPWQPQPHVPPPAASQIGDRSAMLHRDDSLLLAWASPEGSAEGDTQPKKFQPLMVHGCPVLATRTAPCWSQPRPAGFVTAQSLSPGEHGQGPTWGRGVCFCTLQKAQLKHKGWETAPKVTTVQQSLLKRICYRFHTESWQGHKLNPTSRAFAVSISLHKTIRVTNIIQKNILPTN